jgi:hypothetical protein
MLKPAKKNVVSYRARNHMITVDIETGAIEVSQNKLQNIFKPAYNPDATCIVFNDMLKRAFELYYDVEQMTKYFWDCVGMSMLDDDYEVVLFGGNPALKRSVLDVLSYAINTSQFSSVETPPCGPFTDDGLENTLVVPFGGRSMIASGEISIAHAKADRESSGVLNKCISGLSRVLRNGKVKVTNDAINAERKYFRNMDPVGNWIKDRIALLENDKVSECARTMFNDFNRWNKKRTIREYEFRRELQSRGIALNGDGNCGNRKFVGVMLKG